MYVSLGLTDLSHPTSGTTATLVRMTWSPYACRWNRRASNKSVIMNRISTSITTTITSVSTEYRYKSNIHVIVS